MDTGQYQFYKNAQYTNTRNEKKTLIISVEDGQSDSTLGSTGEFSLDLFEPLKIDKHSEVYLDNFISVNSNTSLGLENSGFCLRINEFNMNSNAASSDETYKNTLNNSIFIPNEHETLADNHVCVLNKAKKFNYVCDINPCKLGRISGKITNINNNPIFHGTSATNLFTYSLVGITTFGVMNPTTSDFPRAGETFTLTFGGAISPPSSISGTFLSNITSSSSVIHFTTNINIKDQDSNSVLPFNNIGSHHDDNSSIIFNFTDTSITFTIDLSTGTNDNATLINSNGGFVAEFLIISKE